MVFESVKLGCAIIKQGSLSPLTTFDLLAAGIKLKLSTKVMSKIFLFHLRVLHKIYFRHLFILCMVPACNTRLDFFKNFESLKTLNLHTV